MKKVFLLFLLVWSFSFSETIKFSMLTLSGKHRALNRKLIAQFQKENPGITVDFKEMSNTEYHNYIKAKEFVNYDVVWWFGGFQLKEMAQNNEIEAITDFWTDNNLENSFSSSKSSVSHDNEIYALPLSYYQWGMYYNKNVFKKLGLEEPKTWSEFKDVMATLKQKGKTPIVIGVKNNWTAGSWFSYLNLRINGLNFHLDLLAGKKSYDDPKVRKVFEVWKELLDMGYFNSDNMNTLDWKGVLPYLYREKAGMTLIGNFVTSQVQPAQLKNIGFFKFPIMDSSMKQYEEAPTDVLFIPKNSKNKAAAKKFLMFMSKPNIQQEYNDTLGFISPNSNSRTKNEYFLNKGSALLKKADGFSQFFDRDTSKKMAESGFKILGDFMRNPNIDNTIDRLKKARKENL